MPDLYALIADFVAKTSQKISEARSDGSITFAEAFGIFTDCVERLVSAAQSLSLPGSEKKAAVLAAVDKLFDTLLAPIDIPYIPDLIERTVVDPALKKLALAAADGLIEFFVARLSKPTDATV